MAQSLRGQCLVAAKALRDPNFYKTIVLIVEHGSHGAMGLVINRPSTILVRNALEKFFDFSSCEALVYVGGPVEPAALLVLHNLEELSGGEAPILPTVYIGNSEESFREVVTRASQEDPLLRYRIFSGCSGWSPGQLEAEIARGDWLITGGDPTLVYSDDPYMVYDEMQQRVFAAHRLLPVYCPNPHLN